MVTIKNVAVVGASGHLGKPVLDAIVESGKFNVTVLSRLSSKSEFPPSVTVIRVDYTSVESLTEALKGQDAVVSTVGTSGLLAQRTVFDAAIAAGVKRFLPSEFGSDLDNAKQAALPVFKEKIIVAKYFEDKISAGASIAYTRLYTGPFLDWGLTAPLFLGDWNTRKPRLFNDGDRLFSTTTLPSICLAVISILSGHYEETKNKSIRIQNAVTSQNKLLALANKLAPEKKWEPVPTDIEDVYKSANEALKKGGEITNQLRLEYIYVAIFGGPAYGCTFEKVDNELLGVPVKTDEDIEAIMKPLLDGAK